MIMDIHGLMLTDTDYLKGNERIQQATSIAFSSNHHSEHTKLCDEDTATEPTRFVKIKLQKQKFIYSTFHKFVQNFYSLSSLPSFYFHDFHLFISTRQTTSVKDYTPQQQQHNKIRCFHHKTF